MMARFGMLECGNNFKGSMASMCDSCNLVDDENHRMNYCPKYQEFNNYHLEQKVDFSSIYASDPLILKPLICEIAKVWNVKNGRGVMQTGTQ